MFKKCINTYIKKIIFVLGVVIVVSFGSIGYISYATAYRFYAPKVHIKVQQRRSHQRKAFVEQFQAQEIILKTQDNINVAALLVEREHASRIFLVCHGYGMSKEHMRYLAEFFPNETMLFIDFRAHGQSSGTICSFGYYEQRDIAAAVEYIKSKDSLKNLVLVGLGCSMGAATLIMAAGNGMPFNALILDAPFARFELEVSHVFNQKTGLPRMFFMPIICLIFKYMVGVGIHEINPVECAAQITCPVLLMHSLDDDFVRIEHAYELQKALNTFHDFWLLDSAKHCRIAHKHSEAYKQRINNFLSALP